MDIFKPFRLKHSQLGPSIQLDNIQKLLASDIDPSINFIGQQRAQQALEFGLDMNMTGYNLFVMLTILRILEHQLDCAWWRVKVNNL